MNNEKKGEELNERERSFPIVKHATVKVYSSSKYVTVKVQLQEM